MEKEFKILDLNGKLHDVDKFNFKNENLKIMVEKEALGKENPGGKEPEYIKHCKRFGLDWEPMCDQGHMRMNPVGTFLFNMISDYSKIVVEKLGIPVYEVRGSPMFRSNEKAIKEHAKLYGDRLYEFEVEKKKFLLRYAACFAQFAMMKDWIISYKNMPFGVFEIADSYRLEQSGELFLCFRLRRFYMPDCHVFCRDLEEAADWAYKLHDKVYNEIEELGLDYVSLYNMTSKEFFEKNKDFIMKLVRREKKPVLLCFYPPEKNYYWKLNIEYMIIDKMKRAKEIATVQIDVGNSERFGIKYTDKDNVQKHPIILHTAMIGSIERYLYTLFDKALKQKNPVFPLWLSPVQVRLCPINDSFVKYCEGLIKEFEKNKIRIDLDDRIESIDKKVRDAEMEWVPYIVVIGEREKRSGKLAVRYRETGKVKSVSTEILMKEIKEVIKDYPFRPLPLPRHLSKRPSFI